MVFARGRIIALTAISVIALFIIIGCGGGSSTDTPAGHSINGTFLHETGMVPDGQIAVLDTASQSLVGIFTTDADGAFDVSVNSGQYVVLGLGDGFYSDPVILNSAPGGVQLNLAAEVVEPGRVVAFGFVSSNDNQLPVPGALLVTLDDSYSTDAAGFYFIPDMNPGSPDVEVMADGFVVQDGTINSTGDVFHQNFSLVMQAGASTGSIDGVVYEDVDDSGDFNAGDTFLGGAVLSLGGGSPFTTNWNGEYMFSNVPTGIYSLTVSRTGYQDREFEIDLQAADPMIELDIALLPDPAGRVVVTGNLLDPEGDPVVESSVLLSNPLIGTFQENGDALGVFRFENIPPAEYTLTVIPGATQITLARASIFIDVPNDTTLFEVGAISVPFNNTGGIFGEAFLEFDNNDGRVLFGAGTIVTAVKMDEPFLGFTRSTNTTQEAYYALQGLPIGRYEVTAYDGQRIVLVVGAGGNQGYVISQPKTPSGWQMQAFCGGGGQRLR